MKNKFLDILSTTLSELNYPIDNIVIQIPKNPNHGDFTTNYPLINSKKIGKPPIEIAEIIVNALQKKMDPLIEKIEFISPGFINIKINSTSFSMELPKIKKADKDYGKNSDGNGKSILVEFVSANPTGPLTIGHGRNAILGDSISRIFEWNGYNVQREYYFNNAGRQMRVLGESVYERYMELLGLNFEIPEGGYEGEYIKEISKKVLEEKGESLVNDKKNPIFKKLAETYIFNDIKKTLQKIEISFDTFFNENTLYENNAIDDILRELKNKKLIYEKDGATWFKGTALGRETDRVIVKSSGEPTYRLPDIAYHKNKYMRGYDLMIDVFGADHMDAYPDVLSAIDALGFEKEKVNVVIHQFVTILKDGNPIKMSTRKANFISLDQLIDEVSPDVTRFFFIMRSMNSHLNFDIDIAKEQSDINPVFYIQYAHARCCNIIKRSDKDLKDINIDVLNELTSEQESKIISKLLEFPNIVKKCIDTLEPQNISNYLTELSSALHSYYAKERVVDLTNPSLSEARLYLIDSIRIVIRNGLSLLKISAPKKM
jgi:arginyl-tRNA synthetase